jgi:hypothetical protein
MMNVKNRFLLNVVFLVVIVVLIVIAWILAE